MVSVDQIAWGGGQREDQNREDQNETIPRQDHGIFHYKVRKSQDKAGSRHNSQDRARQGKTRGDETR